MNIAMSKTENKREDASENISLHLKNIYEDRELEEEATTEDFSIVRTGFKVGKISVVKDFLTTAVVEFNVMGKCHNRKAT